MSRFYSEPVSINTESIEENEKSTPRISNQFEAVCGKKELTNEIITTRSPKALQDWFASQRTKLAFFLYKGEKKIEHATNSQQTYEKKFLKTYVDPIIEPAKKEDFAVGSGITIIGVLSGLIINKNVKQLRYIKPIMPLTLALIGFKLSLPETFKSFTDVSYKVEGNFVSENFLQKQASFVNKVKCTEQKIIDTAEGIQKCVKKEGEKVKEAAGKVATFFS
ncbi:hypothetical protein HANVADRAFT_52018 [Hanseniaspora valbyensis NRRL Y-1626]|uniref:MICOS complex subunit n=1 Tax=Hanseniaspora valbyensis NRRL Y-1626 TaxID=766949 RepID=A0A1B7TGR0_9ASCO|nr:hypothetical protein HANVADRAFT_52018 [Hanseniaspora valbyensis NRRL Y-1626]